MALQMLMPIIGIFHDIVLVRLRLVRGKIYSCCVFAKRHIIDSMSEINGFKRLNIKLILTFNQ